MMIGMVKGAVGGGGGWCCPGGQRAAMAGARSTPSRPRCGGPPTAAGRRRSADQHCCVPSGCSRYAGEPIDPEDPGDAVRVVCSNPTCVAGSWMHADCYDDWLQRVLFYIRYSGYVRVAFFG